jgi:hypothetical protein
MSAGPRSPDTERVGARIVAEGLDSVIGRHLRGASAVTATGREVRALSITDERLHFEKLRKPPFAVLAAAVGLLVSAEWSGGIPGGIIDEHVAGAKPGGDQIGPRPVGQLDIRGQSVARVVGDVDG